MVVAEQGLVERLAGFAKRRRGLLLAVSGGLVVYTIFGFIVAPWLVSGAAIDTVKTRFDSELRLERLVINPFALSLRIDGLELDDPAGDPIARAASIYANFELSSLFRRAWSFADIRFEAPALYVVRDGSGSLNLAALAGKPAGPDAAGTQGSGGIPRVFVRRFAINEARFDWKDRVPAEPVETVFGPVSVEVIELNTLPGRAGEQTVVITTETEGTLSWTGSLQLNPLASAGRASVAGSHFPLLSSYLRHETGLDIVDGIAGIDFDYSVAIDDTGRLTAAIENLDLEFIDVRVRTFHAEPDDVRQSREFLHIPRIALNHGAMHWPERTVDVAEIAIEDTRLDLARLDTGEFDFARGAARASTDAAADDAPVDQQQDPLAGWNVALDRFAVDRLGLSLVDRSVEPAAEIGLRDLSLELRQISNRPGAEFPMTLSLSALKGGTLNLGGDVTVLPEPALEFDVSVDRLALGAAQPYVGALADLSLESGYLNLEGRFVHDGGEPLGVEADLEIVDFLITETEAGTRLGSWSRLVAEQLDLSVRDRRLAISKVRVEQPYGDIRIDADGRVNLGRVSRAEAAEGDGTEPAMSEEVRPADAPAAFGVTIGRVLIEDAAAYFVDESLPLPFSATVAKLGGSLTTITTDSVEPSSIDLEGVVDEHGFVRVSGVVTPLDIKRNTDMDVVFENVDVPKFSAYSIPFAGREIASGRLDLDLGYRVSDGRLVGENNIVLRDFELGEKVPHPGAASLPLGLAVGLLKDASGKIDIDLPVRGDLNDPEFGYGRVIAGALANLIVKIATSPFALLGNLVGAEPDELEYINFLPGRADLTPPEAERVQKLTEALSLRPVLRLEINGVIDRDVDSLALRTMSVDGQIESRLNTAASAGDESTGFAERRLEAIESLYRESAGDGASPLEALRDRFTAAEAAAASGEEQQRFDALAYTAELRNRLIEREPLAEAAIVALARQRATNTREAVVAAEPSLEPRVSVIDLREEKDDGDERIVRMKVSLSVAGREAPSPDTSD